MADLIKVATTKEVPPDTMKAFSVNGKDIMICNVQGSYFALDDICSHEHCSLSGEGFLDNTTIICGCHGAQFNAQSGKVLSPPATSNLNTYKVVIKEENIYLEV